MKTNEKGPKKWERVEKKNLQNWRKIGMEGKVKGNRKQKLTNAAKEGFLGLKV